MAIAVDAFLADIGTSATGDYTVTALPTHANGDLLVCVVFISRDAGSENNTITTPTSGWTAVANTVGVANFINREGLFRAFYKKAASAPETPPDFSTEGEALKTNFVGTYTISGFDDPAAIVQNAATEDPTGDVNAAIPSVTVNANGSLIIIGALMTNDNLGADTVPSGFTERYGGTPNNEYTTFIADDILDSFAGVSWANTWASITDTSEITFALSIEPAAGGVSITDVDTDEAWTDGDTGLVITGTGFV